MKILEDYFDARKKVFEYFGYVEDWVVIPLEDSTEYYWYLDGEGYGNFVYFGLTEKEIETYSNEIYTQRHLPKWVYRGLEYTMICVDTHTDGNKFLQIFDNSKERSGALPDKDEEDYEDDE